MVKIHGSFGRYAGLRDTGVGPIRRAGLRRVAIRRRQPRFGYKTQIVALQYAMLWKPAVIRSSTDRGLGGPGSPVPLFLGFCRKLPTGTIKTSNDSVHWLRQMVDGYASVTRDMTRKKRK